jgi:transcriptional regulator with XRE-family HTH domain
MDPVYLLGRARRARGLTQAELAARSGTSQATLSAYERGVKSPSVTVASRILEATGHDLNLRVHIDWVEHHPPGIVAFWAPSMLWSVGPPDCFATLAIPDFIRNTGMRDWDMRDREQRKGGLRAADPQGLAAADDPLDGRRAARRRVGRARPPRPGPRAVEMAHPVGQGASQARRVAVLPDRRPGRHLDHVGPRIPAVAPTSAAASAEALTFRPAAAAVTPEAKG